MAKKPKAFFLFIVLLTFFAIIVDLPKVKIFNRQFSHPKISTKLIKTDLEPKLGLDLAGGVQLVMSADMGGVEAQDRDNALESAKNIIENRINSLGAKEPLVQSTKASGQYRVIVEIPGISDIDQAVSIIKRVALLEFKTLKPNLSLEASSSVSPNNFESTGLTGRDLKRAIAQPSRDPQTPGYVVSLQFTPEGAKKFEKITKDNLEKPVAIFLDNELISAPTVQSVISDGNAQISGRFTAKEAKQLAIELNGGALPVPLKIESQTRVGPTLGADSIKKSIFAAGVGLASVVIFMLVYYRILGVFAIFALAIYTLLAFAVFKIFGVTLTLAGIAGFILSIGMAVDANILIFERIREEVRWGKPRLEAQFAGFDRAWTSIRDSNVSSLITTVILFNFGTGAIRGFALTLAIGILISMFSAITVSRTFIRMFWNTSVKK